MAWAKLTKPAFIMLGSFVRGFFYGVGDEMIGTFSDAEITRFGDEARMLSDCEPWENHLKSEGYDKINKALRAKNYSHARKIIDDSATETASPWCIDALKMAVVDVCTKCTTLLKESLPEGIIIPKSN